MRQSCRSLGHAGRAVTSAYSYRTTQPALPVRCLSSRATRSVAPRGSGNRHGQVVSRGPGGPPWANLGRIFDDMGMEVFNDPFFRPFFARGPGGAMDAAEVAMGLDIAETEKEYIVKAELPGVKKEDVKVTFHDGVLNISAERKQEAAGEDEHHRQHYSDFSYGKVSRSLRVPDAAEKNHVDANLEDGVLTVKVKKGEDSKPQDIPIK